MSVYDELMNEQPQGPVGPGAPGLRSQTKNRLKPTQDTLNPSIERDIGDATRASARSMGGTHQAKRKQELRFKPGMMKRTTRSWQKAGMNPGQGYRDLSKKQAPTNIRQAAGTTYEGPSLREMILELGTAAKEYLARRRGNNPGGKSGAELYQAIPRSAGRDVMRQSGYDWNSNRSSRTVMDMWRRKRAGIPVTNPGNAPERGEAGWEGLRHLKTVGQVRKNYPKAARDWTEYEGPSLSEQAEYIARFLEEGKRLDNFKRSTDSKVAAVGLAGLLLQAGLGANAISKENARRAEAKKQTPPAITAPATPGKASKKPNTDDFVQKITRDRRQSKKIARSTEKDRKKNK